MNFSDMGLSQPILKAINDQGYTTPTPIQIQAIPPVLQGKDVMAAAQTGTGKTAGFTLPILEKLSQGHHPQSTQVRALILTPTRELAAQVQESVVTYGKNLSLSSTVVFGGVNITPQIAKLRKGVDILVATPGRLLDLYHQKAVQFGQLEILILDEADRMLDMGFIHDIKKIISALPKERQTLMFSATFSDDVRKLARGLVRNPIEIAVNPTTTTAERVDQFVCAVDKNQKTPFLAYLIKRHKWEQVLVFCKTKHGANRVALQLEKNGISSSAIHGNKSQNARTKALADFKKGEIKVLVATDIAARGLDIDQLPHVVNYDLPNVPEDYVHRIGRTGRAGAAGEAYSLVCKEDYPLLSAVEKLIKQLIPRKYYNEFVPVHTVPESNAPRQEGNSAKVKQNQKQIAKQPHRDGQKSGENSTGHQFSATKPKSFGFFNRGKSRER